MMQTCTRCGKTKPKTDFYLKSSGRGKKPAAECKECSKDRTKTRYRSEKYDYIRAQGALYQKKKYARIKDAVFNAYGGWVCACCGETERPFLTIDHINNDGAEFRRLIMGGQNKGAGLHTYKWLYDHGFPEGLQVLCANCQQGKRMCNGVCPHQVRRNDYPHVGVGPSGPKCEAPATQAGEEIV